MRNNGGLISLEKAQDGGGGDGNGRGNLRRKLLGEIEGSFGLDRNHVDAGGDLGTHVLGGLKGGYERGVMGGGCVAGSRVGKLGEGKRPDSSDGVGAGFEAIHEDDMLVAKHALHEAEPAEGGEIDLNRRLTINDEGLSCFGNFPADAIVAEDGIAEAKDEDLGGHGRGVRCEE